MHGEALYPGSVRAIWDGVRSTSACIGALDSIALRIVYAQEFQHQNGSIKLSDVWLDVVLNVVETKENSSISQVTITPDGQPAQSPFSHTP
jgi:hypothetical protein